MFYLERKIFISVMLASLAPAIWMYQFRSDLGFVGEQVWISVFLVELAAVVFSTILVSLIKYLTIDARRSAYIRNHLSVDDCESQRILRGIYYGSCDKIKTFNGRNTKLSEMGFDKSEELFLLLSIIKTQRVYDFYEKSWKDMNVQIFIRDHRKVYDLFA